MNGRYYVGEWLIEPEQSRLVRGSESAKLDPKSIQVLSFLAQHPNEVLTKEQIIDSVWDGAFVSDEVLTTAIWGIRKTLGDDAKEPLYIQTIPRRGYRLIAPVERGVGETSGRWAPSPYPGLSAFSQRDAPFFFGREEEVEALWTKLQDRTLLALIGRSGAGKSSLLRAGLIPACPEGWGVLLCQPRNDPFRALEGFDAWRSEHAEALVIVDQFEELFTLNDEETQGRFAGHLAHLSQSGVHVLLAMRDDFLIRCHSQPGLAPVFKDLTPVLPLEGVALRRALVEPARASGYRFEDEALVAEILTEVSREKGALPLLAFAASRLWQKRDREGRRLTREAYLSIGGVAGALAKQAEDTLAKIGLEREPMVREVFRNLVSAQGTRVPSEKEELLTVFPDRETAAGVLGQLIDARLLTSADDEVEIIHESLLTVWPRLVRWQTRDADAAVFRDQLRQASRAWVERGRPRDLLWTGTSFRELGVFQEHYSGGLTATEKEFAEAAMRLSESRRRRRRIAVAGLVVVSIAVALVTSSLWRRSRAEALRAEASKLLALGQLELESYPTAALAYAIKSLEMADSEEARRFALRALQVGPTAIDTGAYTEEGREAHVVSFSPNGEWLAVGGYRNGQLLHRGGREPLVLSGEYSDAGFRAVDVGFGPDGDILVTNQGGDVRLWTVPEGREIQRKPVMEKGGSGLFMRGAGFFTSTTVAEREVIRWWPLNGHESRLVGSTDALSAADINPAGTLFAYPDGNRVHLRSLETWNALPAVVEHPAKIGGIAFAPDGESLAASNESGEIRIWPAAGTLGTPQRVLKGAEGAYSLRYSPHGRWLAAMCEGEDGRLFARLWDLKGPSAARPLTLASDRIYLNNVTFDPTERWIVTAEAVSLTFWPLEATYPWVFDDRPGAHTSLAFTPDGETLLAASGDVVRAWPLGAEAGQGPRVLLKAPIAWPSKLAISPNGELAAVSGGSGLIYVIPISGGTVQELKGFSEPSGPLAVAFSPDGRLVIGAPLRGVKEEKVVRVWDLETGTERALGPVPGAGEGAHGGVAALAFVDQDHVLGTSYMDGLFLMELRNGESKLLHETPNNTFALSRTGLFGYGTFAGITPGGWLVRFDLNGGVPEKLDAYGNAYGVSMDRTETMLATGGLDGIVRIGPVSGGEPHLFFGHKGLVHVVAFSPDGHWVASAGADMTIRLWPVPDVTKTPPHKRSHEEFLSMLLSWTNLRVVPDEGSSTGWKLEVGPFSGWAKLPES